MHLDSGRHHGFKRGNVVGAERGWIGDPQPEKEWHTPGWLSEKGGPSHFHSAIFTRTMRRGVSQLSKTPHHR
jgi:hypothetical protein